jgi:hypothetical protein
MGVVRAASLEDTMSTSVDRPRVHTGGPSGASVSVLASVVDVPGMLADRIGDLYASEERRRRRLRTERMILKAQSIK